MSSAKMLLIFVDETDTWEDMPLYEAIVRKLAQAGVSGATVQAGIMGYGNHHPHVHRKRLFGIPDDRPITITVVEQDEVMRRVTPDIRPMVQDGLMVMLDVELVD